MALRKLVLVLLAVVSGLILGSVATREVPARVVSHRSLEARLKGSVLAGGGLMECWNSLLELKSCTNEIVLFFLNGESYLGQECCRSILVITSQCWPSMFASIGFTSQERDILRGYCDATAAPPGAGTLPPPTSVQAPLAPLATRQVHV